MVRSTDQMNPDQHHCKILPWGRGSVLPSLPGSVPHNLGVDSAGDTVVQLGIKLGQSVSGVHRSLKNQKL